MNFSSAITRLFSDYNVSLTRFVSRKIDNKEDAEEIVQDAFYNFMRTKDIERIENPRAFLYKTANNLALNHIRKGGYRESHLQTLENEENNSTPSLEREVFAFRDIQALQENIDSLPDLTRRIFLMSRIEDKTYPQIAGDLNISVSSVQKHIIKAFDYLNTHLDQPT